MNIEFPKLAPLCKTAGELDENVIVVLFGSRARGDHELWSDYDVYVLSEQVISVEKLYRSVKDLRLDLQFVTVAEFESRLQRWVRGQSSSSQPKLKKLRTEVGMLLHALDGICLLGEEAFQRFREMRDQWVQGGLMPDPAWSRVVSAEDGFTEFQRSLLTSVATLCFRRSPTDSCVKSAKVVGDASQDGLAGASFLYRVLIRMLQPWTSRYPMFEGQGNFGSRSGMRAAAMRYTECRASHWMRFGREQDDYVAPEKLVAAADSFRQLASQEQVTVEQVKAALLDVRRAVIGQTRDFAPPLFPNLLANGTYGIPGVSSAFPSFWLPSVADAMRLAMEEPDATDDALLDALGPPDLACGGVLLDLDEIRTALKSGNGVLRMSAQHEIAAATNGTGQAIAIVSLPPGVASWDLQEELSKACKNGELPGLKQAKDESCLELGFRLELLVTKEADIDLLVERIFAMPLMRAELPIDLQVIRDGELVTTTYPELIREEASRWLERLGSKKAAFAELKSLRALDKTSRRMQ